MNRIDVAVIGAGAAGLAAAAELRRLEHDVVVLEARDRIGGRVLTRLDPRVPVPIELGAEFIHGEAPETERVLSDAGLLSYEVVGEFWRAQRGKFRRADFWEAINRVLQRIDAEKPDQSFADFLATRPGGRSLARARTAARQFVQGFYAADLEEISVRFVAPEDEESPSEAAARSARLVEGYDRITEWLARDLSNGLRLGTPVREIAWRPKQVEVTFSSAGGTSRVEARAAVITVPLGVLQAPPEEPGGIAFRPDPARVRRAIDRLAMGSVTRLTVWFREFPWRKARDLPEGASLEHMRFLHTPDEAFPTWWTTFPLRWPMAVAWCGGPPGADLARQSRAQIVDLAVRGLARAMGVSRRRVESRVLDAWLHDWDGDPYSRGAYSYPRVGGSGAARALAKPVEETLFFAGEAADTEGQSGTVEGAIASGLRAARQVDSALGR